MSMIVYASNRRSGRISDAIAAGLMVGPSILLILAALHTPTVPPLSPAPASAAARFGCSALLSEGSLGAADRKRNSGAKQTGEHASAAISRGSESCVMPPAVQLP